MSSTEYVWVVKYRWRVHAERYQLVKRTGKTVTVRGRYRDERMDISSYGVCVCFSEAEAKEFSKQILRKKLTQLEDESAEVRKLLGSGIPCDHIERAVPQTGPIEL